MATKGTSKTTTVRIVIRKQRKKGKASKKHSTNKNSKNYKKPYKGQGR